MGRKINKPRIKVQSFFIGQNSAESVFADVYCQIFNDMRKFKSSADTIARSKVTYYNDDNLAREGGGEYAS